MSADAAKAHALLVQLLSNRAAAYLELRLPVPAMADARHCIALDPGFVKGHLRLAAAYEALGRLSEAAATLEKALELPLPEEPHAGLVARLADVKGKLAAGGASTRGAAAAADLIGPADDEPGAGATEYTYDADGARLVRKDSAGTTLYLPGGNELLLTADGRKEGTRYYSFDGDTVAGRSGGTVQFLFEDHHGTATTAVDATSGHTPSPSEIARTGSGAAATGCRVPTSSARSRFARLS